GVQAGAVRPDRHNQATGELWQASTHSAAVAVRHNHVLGAPHGTQLACLFRVAAVIGGWETGLPVDDVQPIEAVPGATHDGVARGAVPDAVQVTVEHDIFGCDQLETVRVEHVINRGPVPFGLSQRLSADAVYLQVGVVKRAQRAPC